MPTRLIPLLLLAILTTIGAVRPPANIHIPGETPSVVANHELNDLRFAATSRNPQTNFKKAEEEFPASIIKPSLVASWWKTLSAPERSTMSRFGGSVIGNLAGLPYDVRDSTNRESLRVSEEAARLTAKENVGRGAALTLNDKVETFANLDKALLPVGGVKHYLIGFAPDGSTAAVAVGNVQRATYVGFLVPGMYFSVEHQINLWTAAASNIQKQQNSWLKKLGQTGSSAVVAWIGYQTPTIATVTGLDFAEVGARLLAQESNGLNAARPNSKPFQTLYAHSYGSTLASLALTAKIMKVNALAIVGSPGIVAKEAEYLNIPNNQVFASADSGDIIPLFTYFGPSPVAQSFGAVIFGSNGGKDPITGKNLLQNVGHDDYFDAGSEALRNMSLIGINDGRWVTNGTTRNGVLQLSY